MNIARNNIKYQGSKAKLKKINKTIFEVFKRKN